MRDYRELIRSSGLYASAKGGRYARVAVLDSGIPTVKGILSYCSRNFTSGSARDAEHATFVGSLLFGRGQIWGICPDASAYFGNVFEGGIAKPDSVAKAISCAVNEWDADVINLSLGFSRDLDCPKPIREACKMAADKGVTLVAAAGNDGGKALWPAALPEVICVGSTNGAAKADFSNTGEIDFVVPGVNLEGYSVTGDLTTRSGTSFSAALVSGLAALLVSEARIESGERPGVQEIRGGLIELCSDLGDPGWDQETGYGTPFLQPVQKPGIFDRILSALKSLFRRN